MLVGQGIQSANRDDWGEAENLFHQALQQAPEECLIYGNLGVVYERSGRFMEAATAYERAHKCQPQDPTYRYYSNDLQTAFAPDLDKRDLPILILGVRGDGVIFVDGGKDFRQRPGDLFNLYRVQVSPDRNQAAARSIREIEFARGEIIDVRQQMSLGRLLLLKPEWRVQRGDMVHFDPR